MLIGRHVEAHLSTMSISEVEIKTNASNMEHKRTSNDIVKGNDFGV
jgi:hypothetical protein